MAKNSLLFFAWADYVMLSKSLNLLFFPGVILHELSHVFACALLGVGVREIKFFGTREAYVLHDSGPAYKILLITLMPLILGNLLAFGIIHSINFYNLNLETFFFAWLAFSFMFFSFPSKQDIDNSLNTLFGLYHSKVFGHSGILDKIVYAISFPFVALPLSLALIPLMLFEYVFILRIAWAAVMFFGI
ncbi:MAG: hypothetical protein Q7K42_00640 [Candidatus Diapherotrites archaeon]|nr:hypothetical protein [Candidatus Diapherotrites archaeon]